MADPAPVRPPNRPRWVNVLAVAAAVVVGIIIVVALMSGGEHGPGRHLPGGDSGDHTRVDHGP